MVEDPTEHDIKSVTKAKSDGGKRYEVLKSNTVSEPGLSYPHSFRIITVKRQSIYFVRILIGIKTTLRTS